MMEKSKNSFSHLVAIMRRLRGPGGCPWDAEQTHDSLKRYLLEEAYEVVEAIDNGDMAHLKEELGDLILQPVFHACIAEEGGEFTMDEVIAGICDKLVRRHPHVFGEMVVKTSEEQIANWEKIKKGEKGEERKSALAGIPPALPSLLKAQKITEKAARAGFEWQSVDQVLEKIEEELREFRQSLQQGDREAMAAELGDLLFATANVGRFLAIDPEEALRQALNRFISRFEQVERVLESRNTAMSEASLDEMLSLWQEAKELERKKSKG